MRESVSAKTVAMPSDVVFGTENTFFPSPRTTTSVNPTPCLFPLRVDDGAAVMAPVASPISSWLPAVAILRGTARVV